MAYWRLYHRNLALVSRGDATMCSISDQFEAELRCGLIPRVDMGTLVGLLRRVTTPLVHNFLKQLVVPSACSSSRVIRAAFGTEHRTEGLTRLGLRTC